MAVLTDNTAALQNALKLSGFKQMQPIAREIAWRKAKLRWSFEVGHLPSEQNDLADALSRRYSPSPVPFPVALKCLPRARAPLIHEMWRLK